MGVIRGLLGLAATAGAAFAAVKVAQKYEENKELDIEAAAAGDEPEEVPSGSALGDLARAAGEVLNEAGAKMRDAAEKAGVDTEGLKGALQGAGSAIVDAGTAVAGYVAGEAPAAVERLKDSAQDVLALVKDTVTGIGMTDADDYDDDDEDDEETFEEAEAAAEEAEAAAEEAEAAAEEAEAAAEEAEAAAEAAGETEAPEEPKSDWFSAQE